MTKYEENGVDTKDSATCRREAAQYSMYTSHTSKSSDVSVPPGISTGFEGMRERASLFGFLLALYCGTPPSTGSGLWRGGREGEKNEGGR